MNYEKLVYLCASSLVSKGGGGLETYVSTLASHKMPGVSEHIIRSLKSLDQSQFKLLHAHEETAIGEITGECPSIFTAHNHASYCPSGTHYLPSTTVSCPRSMSVMGCTWGHLVDGCGSKRPQNIVHKISTSYQLLSKLKKLKIPVIANSDYVRSQLIKNGLPLEQTVTLRCGVAVLKSTFAPLTQEIHRNQRILFVGRIVPDKGLQWLITALVKTSALIQLDIAGDGWYKPQIEKLVNQLGLSDRVVWHGWCNSEKLDVLYEKCFAVIFPSVWPEPAGLVTLEAYARHRAVIASRAGGIPEYLQHEQTGILVPVNDTLKLSDAITDLSINYQKSYHLGEQGYALFLKEFTMDIHVNRLKKIYEKAIEDFYIQRAYR
ncbi:glycosyltransferase family 4 protein [Phormidesmis sp. 146-33]